MCGLYVWGNALTGATVSSYYALDLNMTCSVAVTNDGFIRCYNHGTGSTRPESVMWLAAPNDTADYLLDFEGTGVPWSDTNKNIVIRVVSTDYYIPTGTATVGLQLIAAYTDGILISGAATDGIHISGACTTGINIGATCTSGINQGAASTSTGSGITSNTTSARTGFYFDDGTSALTGYTETMNVGYVLTNDISGGASVNLSVLHVYLDMRADVVIGTSSGFAALWASALIRNSKTFDGGDLRDIAAIHANLDIAAGSTLAAGSFGCAISIGANFQGTHTGQVACFHIRYEASGDPWDALIKFNETGGASGTGCIATSAGSQDTAKWIKVLLDSTVFKIPLYADS